MIILIKIINILRKRDKYEQLYELKKNTNKKFQYTKNNSNIIYIIFLLYYPLYLKK